MVTKNFMSAITHVLQSISKTSNYIVTSGDLITSTSTSPLRIISSNTGITNYTTTDIPTYSSADGIALLIGSGTTAPSSSDYTLEKIITSYTVSGQSTYVPASSATYDDVFLTITRVVKNETENSFTVSELGCFICNSTTSNTMLIAREVLDTPVTIAPGDSYSFTMTIGL